MYDGLIEVVGKLSRVPEAEKIVM